MMTSSLEQTFINRWKNNQNLVDLFKYYEWRYIPAGTKTAEAEAIFLRLVKGSTKEEISSNARKLANLRTLDHTDLLILFDVLYIRVNTMVEEPEKFKPYPSDRKDLQGIDVKELLGRFARWTFENRERLAQIKYLDINSSEYSGYMPMFLVKALKSLKQCTISTSFTLEEDPPEAPLRDLSWKDNLPAKAKLHIDRKNRS